MEATEKLREKPIKKFIYFLFNTSRSWNGINVSEYCN